MSEIPLTAVSGPLKSRLTRAHHYAARSRRFSVGGTLKKPLTAVTRIRVLRRGVSQ